MLLRKVGNIAGATLAKAQAGEDPLIAALAPGEVVRVRSDVWHSLAPEWIERSISESLARLGLECLDGVLLHNPEFQTKAGESMDAIYEKVPGG